MNPVFQFQSSKGTVKSNLFSNLIRLKDLISINVIKQSFLLFELKKSHLCWLISINAIRFDDFGLWKREFFQLIQGLDDLVLKRIPARSIQSCLINFRIWVELFVLLGEFKLKLMRIWTLTLNWNWNFFLFFCFVSFLFSLLLPLFLLLFLLFFFSSLLFLGADGRFISCSCYFPRFYAPQLACTVQELPRIQKRKSISGNQSLRLWQWKIPLTILGNGSIIRKLAFWIQNQNQLVSFVVPLRQYSSQSLWSLLIPCWVFFSQSFQKFVWRGTITAADFRPMLMLGNAIRSKLVYDSPRFFGRQRRRRWRRGLPSDSLSTGQLTSESISWTHCQQASSSERGKSEKTKLRGWD